MTKLDIILVGFKLTDVPDISDLNLFCSLADKRNDYISK